MEAESSFVEAHEILGIIQMTLWQITHFHKIKSELSRFFYSLDILYPFFVGAEVSWLYRVLLPLRLLRRFLWELS